ncbi:P-loop containing nucleoside triphosphate hydrolase protein [Russula vinacea]|nr:P-loop containing nucleoside triphosphate hydrolase protein [Russula vinacea]
MSSPEVDGNGFSWIGTESHVLSRRLTHPSQRRGTQPVLSSEKDLEKGPLNSYGSFNLRDCLTSSNEANKPSGFNLSTSVMVPGDKDHKVTYSPTLSVYMIQNGLNLIRSVWRFLSGNSPAKDGNAKTILNKCSGLAKPGEMILVLGCPGSGCTTFLKAIANQRDEYSSVSGEVCYGGMDPWRWGKFAKTRPYTIGTVCKFIFDGLGLTFPSVDDTHIATLTVAQTLAFVLSTKTIGSRGRLPRISGQNFDTQAQEMLLTMLNMSHASGTLVGDESSCACWDNPTRGLDASTALDCVKSLRIMTDVLGQTTFVTLYQAGEGIYDLFDRVLVLDEGRQIYLGPPSQARSYFEELGFKSLPRQPTVDYLTGCTDPNERQLCRGRSIADVPSTPETLEQAFRESELGFNLRRELEDYKVSTKDDQEGIKAGLKEGPLYLGYAGQVMALARRQFQMRLQDRFQLVTSFSLSVILAIIIGAAFFDQRSTSNGAFTRTSVIFITMLTSCLDAFGELSIQVGGRGVLHKQTSYSLYRPSALALGNALSDLPFSIVRVLVYDVIIYFMANLRRSGDAFWTFHLFNYVVFLSIQGLFRTLGFVFSSYDAAFRLGAFLVTSLVLSTGYLIPVHEMKRWLFWTEQPGTKSSLYSVWGHAGFQCHFRRSYLLAAFDMDGRDIWRRNFIVLLGWMLFYQVTQILILDFFPQRAGSSFSPLFAKETSETRKLNDQLREQKASRLQARTADNVIRKLLLLRRMASSDPSVFTWEGVSYHVPVSHGTQQLLSDVYGYVKPGTLTALMGASGAGKTTCLDVLAKRKNIGTVRGDILVDGHLTGPDFARSTAYAEQMDVHEGTATVREAMRFSAYLRQPFDVPKEEKNAYVEEMIELLELHDSADAIVHTLGTEARKRLTIGVELASKPELLLFLDEPTSGLDAPSAHNIIRVLRRLANQGQAILCTVHQPSSLLFESFDRLLLLENGGHTVYFGDIGQNSCVVQKYFARYGAVCPQGANIAEYMLDAIGAGMAPRIGHRDWKDIWVASPEFQLVKEEIGELKRSAASGHKKRRQPRAFVTLRRSPDYIFTRLFLHLSTSLFVSLVFFRLGRSQRDLQYRMFSIFWVTVLPSLLLNQVLPVFMANREFSRGMYSPKVFAITQLLGEVPCCVLCATVYWIIMIFAQGFGQGSAGLGGTGLQLVVLIFVELFGVSLGQLVAAITPSVQVGILLDPFIMVILEIFCGVIIPYADLAHTSGWRVWVYQLNPFTRLLSAMLSTELHGLQIRCKPGEFAIFDPPPGQSCVVWANDFVDAFGGYLDNPSDAQACRYCQYKVGEEYMAPLNMFYENRWRDAWIIFAFFAASRFLRYTKR